MEEFCSGFGKAAALGEEMARCAHCGEKLTADARICPRCLVLVVRETPAEDAPVKSAKPEQLNEADLAAPPTNAPRAAVEPARAGPASPPVKKPTASPAATPRSTAPAPPSEPAPPAAATLAAAPATPPVAPASPPALTREPGRSHSPALAFIFGLLIPGAGQAYNGRPIRGFFYLFFSVLIFPYFLSLYGAVTDARRIAAEGGRMGKGGLIWVFLQGWLYANVLLVVIIALTISGYLT